MGAKYIDCSLLLVPIYLMLFLFLSMYCCAIDNITRSQKLFQEQTLISPGQVFELGFFSPTNSGNHRYVGIWYKGISPQTVVWVANRENPLRVANSPVSLRIGDNGNLELVDENESSIWSTNVHVQSNNSVAMLSERGNLELKDGESGEIFWQSFENPGDTFLPNSILGFNAKIGKSYNLTSWKSESDPSFGSFTVGILPIPRPAQLFIWNGSTPHWRSGPWGRLKFIGIPDMDVSYESPFGVVEDADQETTYLTFNFYNYSIATKVFISSDGIIKYLVKINGSNWYTNWESATDPCDAYGVCGPSSVCKVSESPICSCLKGFTPKSDLEWSKRNWTQGCLRQTKLSCEKNNSSPNLQQGKNDGFYRLRNMKLPDLHKYVAAVFDSDSCQTWCQNNCSCRAYAYVNGIGCLSWSEGLVDIKEFSVGGEDLFIRLAHGELDNGQNNKKIIISLATISSGATLCAFLFVCLRQWKANKKRT